MAGWDYTTAAGYPHGLQAALKFLLRDLRDGAWAADPHCADTRLTHGRLFAALAPAHAPYFAGEYRGAPFPDLANYEVSFSGKQGVPAPRVQARMAEYATRIQRAINYIDDVAASNAAPEMKLWKTAYAVSAVFVPFLLIHPYADGNGHMGRFILVALLGRHSYWPDSWTIDPRPNTPEYMPLIKAAEAGDFLPLTAHLVQCVKGAPPAAENSA